MQVIIQFYMKIILSNTSNIHARWSFFCVTSVAVEKKKIMLILRENFSFSFLSSSSLLWTVSLTFQVAYLIIFFHLTVFLP
jgi:hypothetical protein